jgi:hypothetical protein
VRSKNVMVNEIVAFGGLNFTFSELRTIKCGSILETYLTLSLKIF